MFDSHLCLLAEVRQKHVSRGVLSFFIQTSESSYLLKKIHLLTLLLLFFTARFICNVLLLFLCVFILPTLPLCVRAKYRSSEISRVLKLPHKLKVDLETSLPWESVCYIRLSAGLLRCSFAGGKELHWEQSGSQVKPVPVHTSCSVTSGNTDGIALSFMHICLRHWMGTSFKRKSRYNADFCETSSRTYLKKYF